MAKKKAVEKELQLEVNTDAEWDDLLHKPGLWLVDVYRDWAGPCASAQGVLRKYRMEVDEYIQFAVAKADNIHALEMFRHTCEPQWLFVAGGQIVGFLRGSNMGTLTKMMNDQTVHEKKVEAGKATRRPVQNLEVLAKPERIEVVDPDQQAREDAEEAEEEEQEEGEMVVGEVGEKEGKEEVKEKEEVEGKNEEELVEEGKNEEEVKDEGTNQEEVVVVTEE